MSVPDPLHPLDGHCASINDGVLYFLSNDAFQSLPLQKNATWAQEQLGVAVTGAACILVGEGTDAVLYVIGGTSDNDGYSGLQTYTFSSKSWETLTPPVEVLQGRTNHSVAYLQDSNAVLVYAGSQESAPSFLSSQTFLLPLSPPYNIQSYSSHVPPGNLPILQPFNTSHAILAGGSDLNTALWTFDATDGWQEYPTNITAPLPADTRGIVIDGSDGSKVLQVYNMAVSPNEVTQVVLVGADGQPAYTGQTVSGNSTSSRKRKRDPSLSDWPSYNSTGAPTATRSDFAVVQATSGVAVIAGGSNSLPVAMFNPDKNSWVDADAFFDDNDQQPLNPSSTASGSASTTSSTSTASSSSSATSALSGDGPAHSRMLRTLGITLGVLCSIAVIFILILILLRWRKTKQKRQAGYLEENEKSAARLSFADRGASFMKEAGGSVNAPQTPAKAWNNEPKNESHSSLAIIAGKFNRSHSHIQQKSSFDSTAHLVKGQGASEPVELVNIREKRGNDRKPIAQSGSTPPEAEVGRLALPLSREEARERRNRSSGWSKYFATSQPTGPDGLSHLPSAYNENTPISDGSKYTSDRVASHRIPSSVLVAPLEIDFSKTVDGQRLSHVTSGSPAFNDSREDLARRGSRAVVEGQKGLIVDPSRRRSNSDTVSSYNRSTMSSNMTSEFLTESGTTPWTSISPTFKDHLNSSTSAGNRPTSSLYTSSIYEQRIPSRGKSAGFFPGAGTSYRPPKAKLSPTAASSSDWTMLPSAQQRQQQQQLQSQAEHAKAGAAALASSDGRDSTVTVFPGLPSAHYATQQQEQGNGDSTAAPVNSDLGWLNLGLGNNSQHKL